MRIMMAKLNLNRIYPDHMQGDRENLSIDYTY